MKVLVTGASGFVGRALMKRLLREASVTAVGGARGSYQVPREEIPFAQIPDLRQEANWFPVLEAVDCVVHLAGRAHVKELDLNKALANFRAVNVKGTLTLAKQAAQAGVKRLVFVSSIGVNGDESVRPFTPDASPAPQSPYAMSKLEAERELLELSSNTRMEVVVVRPPLVYGPGAPGNLARLTQAVRSGLPFPFGSVRNRRTLVSVDNLADLLCACAVHPQAAGKVFLAGDDQLVSTPEIISWIGRDLRRPVRMVPVPPSCLTFLFRLAGQEGLRKQLLSDLEVDISYAKKELGWAPLVRPVEARWA